MLRYISTGRRGTKVVTDICAMDARIGGLTK